jgi:hypothetical protein
MLRKRRLVITDVSGWPIILIFKGQSKENEDYLILECGTTDRLSRNVGNYQSTKSEDSWRMLSSNRMCPPVACKLVTESSEENTAHIFVVGGTISLHLEDYQISLLWTLQPTQYISRCTNPGHHLIHFTFGVFRHVKLAPAVCGTGLKCVIATLGYPALYPSAHSCYREAV